ncbi:MAG: hypothetical protein LUD15_13590 [Bacteroides sp.]|nr:hypothetical protein [Bacteroides sp.]
MNEIRSEGEKGSSLLSGKRNGSEIGILDLYSPGYHFNSSLDTGLIFRRNNFSIILIIFSLFGCSIPCRTYLFECNAVNGVSEDPVIVVPDEVDTPVTGKGGIIGRFGECTPNQKGIGGIFSKTDNLGICINGILRLILVNKDIEIL